MVLISLAVIDACLSLGFDVTRIAAFPFDILKACLLFRRNKKTVFDDDDIMPWETGTRGGRMNGGCEPVRSSAEPPQSGGFHKRESVRQQRTRTAPPHPLAIAKGQWGCVESDPIEVRGFFLQQHTALNALGACPFWTDGDLERDSGLVRKTRSVWAGSANKPGRGGGPNVQGGKGQGCAREFGIP
jgi:hypothetical protein